MPRYNQPTKSNTATKTTTFEGGAAWTPDNPATELLFTAAVTFAGEDTFYESADTRSKRLVDLVHASVARDPKLVADVARRLRQEFQIRTASVLVACEYVATGAPGGRAVIDSVCQRADEPGEVLAYWYAKHGRHLPRAIKTGLGDAARRLYSERNAIKYDTPSKAFRFGDVLELCHVKPSAEWQDFLFKYVLDNRHHGDAVANDNLQVLSKHDYLNELNPAHRRAALFGLSSAVNFDISEGGFTWEHLSSWLPGGMDAEAWEAVIPSMGVMALIRNLRNFDEKNISNKAVDTVIAKITDADEVAKSRIFPYQVLLAYQFAPSDTWKRALNTTVDLASGNLPRLDNSLLVIDTSGSMCGALSAKSKADRITVAALQASAVARHSRDCDIVIFGDSNRNITSQVRGRSVLGAADHIKGLVGSVGYSTFGHTAIRDNFDPAKHKRAILFTDDQMHDSMDRTEAERSQSYLYQRHLGLNRGADISQVPQVVTFNLGGYARNSTWGKGRIHVTGFSDAIFNMVATLLHEEATAPTGRTV